MEALQTPRSHANNQLRLSNQLDRRSEQSPKTNIDPHEDTESHDLRAGRQRRPQPGSTGCLLAHCRVS